MEPQRLKSRQGWEWIKQGYGLFMKSPLLWIRIDVYLRGRSGGNIQRAGNRRTFGEPADAGDTGWSDGRLPCA